MVWLQDVKSGLVASVTGKQSTVARIAGWVEGFLLRRAETVIVNR